MCQRAMLVQESRNASSSVNLSNNASAELRTPLPDGLLRIVGDHDNLLLMSALFASGDVGQARSFAEKDVDYGNVPIFFMRLEQREAVVSSFGKRDHT